MRVVTYPVPQLGMPLASTLLPGWVSLQGIASPLSGTNNNSFSNISSAVVTNPARPFIMLSYAEALFLKAQRARLAGAAPTPVEIQLQDESEYRWKGKLDFTDNGLDPKSGTMRARAVLDNKDMFLTPGMFGNMRLSSGGQVNALLVPDTAVQTDQTRKLLLVAGKDGTVTAKPVQLGPVIDGLRVIRSGLAPTDRVIITGTQSAAPGGKVDAKPGKIAPDSSAAAQPGSTIAAAGEASFAR